MGKIFTETTIFIHELKTSIESVSENPELCTHISLKPCRFMF